MSEKYKFREIIINISDKIGTFIINNEQIRITAKHQLNSRIYLKIVGENPQNSII